MTPRGRRRWVVGGGGVRGQRVEKSNQDNGWHRGPARSQLFVPTLGREISIFACFVIGGYAFHPYHPPPTTHLPAGAHFHSHNANGRETIIGLL